MCPRLEPLRHRYVHHPLFPPSERYAYPLSVRQLIATVEQPCGIDLYGRCTYDPDLFPGNLAAAPPEALRGILQPGGSDVYGLGVVLWWLLTGQETPFEISVELDRVRFAGWADFYGLPVEGRREALLSRLEASLLPELRSALTQAEAVADWLLSALAEAPEDRWAAASRSPASFLPR